MYVDNGHFEPAKDPCMSRLGRAVARHGLVGHEYQDSRTIWALEDLAKIEELLGALDRSAVWLPHAADLAKVVREPSIALTHIFDKLLRSLRLCGKDDNTQIANRHYARYPRAEHMDVMEN